MGTVITLVGPAVRSGLNGDRRRRKRQKQSVSTQIWIYFFTINNYYYVERVYAAVARHH